MIMTKEYFEANCVYAIEFMDEDYHKFWYYGLSKDIKTISAREYAKGYYLSDEDYAPKAKQDPKVQHFLDVVEYNWFHNKEMLDRLHITSLYALVERALDNWDYK